MSEEWANRQRQTNYLVRKIAAYLFANKEITPKQLYGLSKLSWITTSYQGDNAGYINSTKIPALEDIFNKNFSSYSLKEISEQIAKLMNDQSVIQLVQQQTGFTNLYNAYRDNVEEWIKSNFDVLLPMYKAAYNAKNENDRKEIIIKIDSLEGIPIANKLMSPESFLTPAFFMLDREIKLPIINGKKGVKSLLKKLQVKDKNLVSQFSELIKLYGVGGIKDAADLDQIGLNLQNFISTKESKATKELLQQKETNNENELPLKDEQDLEAIRLAGTIKFRRIHNQLTNKLRNTLASFTLFEGSDKSCLYDVLVHNFQKDEDLLIEVKSSTEMAHMRMAVGQLLSYRFEWKEARIPSLAILVPERPNDNCIDFLKSIKIGLIWFEGEKLKTSDKWLEQITI